MRLAHSLQAHPQPHSCPLRNLHRSSNCRRNESEPAAPWGGLQGLGYIWGNRLCKRWQPPTHPSGLGFSEQLETAPDKWTR